MDELGVAIDLLERGGGVVVVSVGGAGSIPGALAACLLLGAIDVTGRYLMPDFGNFFFYLAVILVVCAFPRGLMGRAQ